MFTAEQKEQTALKEINNLLQLSGSTLSDFGQMPTIDDHEEFDVSNHLILQELNYDRALLQRESARLLQSLNDDQIHAFNNIMQAVEKKKGGFYFVYGYGGTGKTFLWNALASTIRARGEIVLTVASSGIAATLLPGG